MGFQPRATKSSTESPKTPVIHPSTTRLFGTPTTPNLFSSLAKTEAPSTPTTTMQNIAAQNTTAAVGEEAEKKKREVELKAQAEERERQKRQILEEEQRRNAAAEAEYQRQKAEEETQRMQHTAALEANFKGSLEALVSKLNEYSRCVESLRSFKMRLMQNIKLNVEFDAHLDPMLKSIEYVSIIGNDINESLSRLRQVTNSVHRSAKESQQFLLKGSKELPTPEWVLELVGLFCI